MITVKQLRDKLAEYPDGMIVVVDGYEYGYDNPTVYERHCLLNRNDGTVHWAGEHEEVDDPSKVEKVDRIRRLRKVCLISRHGGEA